MAENIEIKARANHWELQMARAQEIADGPAQVLHQEDIFFHCEKGRLKLRCFTQNKAELIGYQRTNQAGPKSSCYSRYPVSNPKALRDVLQMTCGEKGIVRKKRLLFLMDQTRIHFDDVEGLGQFIEIEVVLNESFNQTQGQALASSLMDRLRILPQDLISCAYIDMLLT